MQGTQHVIFFNESTYSKCVKSRWYGTLVEINDKSTLKSKYFHRFIIFKFDKKMCLRNFKKGKNLKSPPVEFELMTFIMVVNVLTHYATCYVAISGKKIFINLYLHDFIAYFVRKYVTIRRWPIPP